MTRWDPSWDFVYLKQRIERGLESEIRALANANPEQEVEIDVKIVNIQSGIQRMKVKRYTIVVRPNNE